MGCSSNKVMTPEVEVAQIRATVIELVRDNPFYRMTFNDFYKNFSFPASNTFKGKIFSDNILVNEHSENRKDLTKAKETLEKKINMLSTNLKLSEMSQCLLKDVMKLSCEKFFVVFQNKDVNSFTDDVLEIFFLFCCRRKVGENKTEKNIFITKLLESTKTYKKENEYYTGKFSFLIVNIIYFCIFCFVYLFFSFSVLSNDTSISKKGLDELYIKKKSISELKCENMSNFLKEKIKNMGKFNSPDFLVQRMLTKCLQPISAIILKDPDAKTAIIDEKELNEIVANIVSILDAKGFIKYFFNEVKL